MATAHKIGDSALAARLQRETEGHVLFDPFSRGRYSTDASHYQIEPIGVVVPKTAGDIHRTLQIAAEQGVPVLPRGGGTSQCGQTVNHSLVLDLSKYLNKMVEFDAASATADAARPVAHPAPQPARLGDDRHFAPPPRRGLRRLLRRRQRRAGRICA